MVSARTAVMSSLALSSCALAGSSSPSPSASWTVNKGMLTSTSYQTESYTVTSCASTVSNCPARSTQVFTTVKPSVTTCPLTVTTTITLTKTGPAVPIGAQPTAWEGPNYPIGGSNAGAYLQPAWIPKTCTNGLTPSLPQEKTNGNSTWGMKGAPTYGDTCPGAPPPWFKGNGTGSGSGSGGYGNGGNGTSSGGGYGHGGNGTSSGGGYGHGGNGTSSGGSGNGGNGTSSLPTCTDTGITRRYYFVVAYQTIAPDGVEKKAITVNGQFPGPLIEANWCDTIEVTVFNALDNEGTTMHWHGILQKGNPWMDGVPSVQQCPIAPGKSFTYRFKADVYGTSWYHSHYSAQYSGGAFGPILIHGPKHADYDIDIGPVILSDWYHDDYYTLVQGTMDSTTGLPFPSNNNLINGKMNYPCANTTAPCTPNAGLSKFFFQKGKKYLLRLINTSSDGMQKFSIDGHKITVVSQDFVPIKPYTTNVVTLGVGQRAEVVVEAVGNSTGAYWMRSQLGTPGPTCCSLPDGVSPNALAVVYYEKSDDTAVPTTTSDVTTAQILDCGNDPLSQTEPLFAVSSDTKGPVTTQELHIDITNNGTAFVWTVNNSTFRGDYNDALLLDANKGALNPKPEWNVYDFKSAGTIRLVVYNNFPLVTHPMHLHGHNMQILAEGFGTWDGTITNSANPVRRDTQILREAKHDGTPAYIVLQIEANNPGVWPFHCHLAWHVSAGLYVNVVEQTDAIKDYKIPDTLQQTCNDWADFTAVEAPDQIDSGV